MAPPKQNQERNALILRMYNAHKPIRAIADAVGLTVSGVDSVLRRYGATRERTWLARRNGKFDPWQDEKAVQRRLEEGKL